MGVCFLCEICVNFHIPPYRNSNCIVKLSTMWNSRKLICGLARKCTSSPGNINPSSITSKKEFHRKYEPEYLDSKEPQVPAYDLLNIKIRSYDFTILENFSGYIHKTAENMGIEVTEWSVAVSLNYLKQSRQI